MYVAISDIHGEYDKLIQLMGRLEDAGWHPSGAQYIFLGDYIDGGPQNGEVLEYVKQFKIDYPETVLLRGNHEEMMYEAYREPRDLGTWKLWKNQGGEYTLKSFARYYGARDMHKVYEWIEWFPTLPTLFETDHFIFVHGGILPNMPASQTSDYERMWLRSRFISSDYDWGKRVIFGHTVAKDKQPLILPNKIGIDTMHHGNGSITGLVLDNNDPEWYTIIQSDR